MQNRIYRFEIVRPLAGGFYEARDDADQSMVTLFEATPEVSRREATRQSLAEIGDRLGCETFSTGSSECIVATTAQQREELAKELERRGLLSLGADASVVQPATPSALPLAVPAPVVVPVAPPPAPPPVMPNPAATPAAGPIAAGLVSDPVNRRQRWGLVVLAIAVVLLVGLAIFLIFFPPSQTVLRLEGSTTIGDELAPRLLVAFLEKKGAKDVAEIADGGDTSHHEIRAKLPGYWRPLVFSVVANGSGNAFKALAAHRADLGMSSRPIKDDEVRLLEGLGDMRSSCCEDVLALDGLAVIVNSNNPVSELTRQQIGSIFRGTVTNWAQVGQRPGPIHLYGRRSDSGTFDTFVALVLGGDKNGFANNLKAQDNGDEIARAISLDPAGIGYVALAQVRSAKALEVSDGPTTTALLPSPFTVATEDYILSRRLFLYAPAQPTALAREFVDFAAGPEGQSVVEAVGFVKQTPVFEEPPMPAGAPEEYRRRVGGLRRMSINFRFRPNEVALDNKALADIPRAQAALFQSHVRSGVQVIGFADSHGTAKRNQQVSDDRAGVVAEKLRAYGIGVEAMGLSSAMPVGDNATADGREKNRRVEVWAR